MQDYNDYTTNDGRRVLTDGGTAAVQGEIGETQTAAASSFFQNGGRGIDYLMANEEQRAEFMLNASLLEYDEWRDLSTTVIENRQEQMTLVSDLRGAGLVESEDIGNLVSRWQTIGDISEDANVGMGMGEPRSDEELPGMGMQGVPLPVFYKDWRIDRRFLEAARNRPGNNLDTTAVIQMTRALGNTIERTMLNGWDRPVDGYTMPGFLNHADRNVVTGASWHDNTTDMEDIRNDVLSAIEALENDEYDDGGYWLYLNRVQNQRLRRLLDTFGGGSGGDTNMRERINEEFDLEISNIRVTKNIPDGEAILFDPSPDVVTLGIAEDIQPIEWETPSGATAFVRLLASMNLKLKSTQSGQMGVVHLTGLNP